jgi:hypothetical protein
MTNNAQEHINQLTNHKRIKYLDISNRDLAGEADLKEFTALTSLNSYNNKFESLEFLASLPQKENLKKINFFGNQIKEIDLAWLLENFPNLEYVNCENNPLSTKNLENLSSGQFGKLIKGIKDKKIKVNSWKGTVLMDLLEYAQKLASQGRTEYQAHIQTLTQISQSNLEKPNEGTDKTPLLIGGAVILAITAALALGYLWGKRKKEEVI